MSESYARLEKQFKDALAAAGIETFENYTTSSETADEVFAVLEGLYGEPQGWVHSQLICFWVLEGHVLFVDQTDCFRVYLHP
ncbi:hypothetical protein NVP2117O_07 [Vibrio phage 2.117.O._10N.261.45.E9]|nr:hypothetical protein NVP1117O_07 [Vibrio phage 1.117.O._10N.261.45.E9]AUR95408.1 hypothetical protein NVP1207B_01 [Vibrio phage 1.207.B._10N.222.51.C2]AUS02299.1 hypothetical protein NVP2117O_07 [Vibrio phage 2.117.O._10N.261.45.E9]